MRGRPWFAVAAMLVSPLVSATSNRAAPPMVGAVVIGNLTSSGNVIFQGVVNPNGLSTSAYFEYGTTTSYGTTTASADLGSGIEDVGFHIRADGALPCGTYYHVRAVAVSSEGTAHGPDATFRTVLCSPTPSLGYGSVSDVTETSAVFHVRVNPNGLPTVVKVNLTGMWHDAGSGTTQVVVEVPVTGMACNTLYGFIVQAHNAACTSGWRAFPTDPELTPLFSTLSCRPPHVQTVFATDTGLGGATLAGAVIPKGSATTAWLEYGSSTSYGTTTAPVEVGFGGAPVPMSAQAAGLLCGRTYHFRAVGQNASGTAYGDDATFTTKTCPAPVADFTGDAKADMLWHHATRGELWEWTMNGAAATATTYIASIDTGWEIRGVGDYDGDRKADILWRHATTGELFLWRMDGAAVVDRTYLGSVDTAYDIVGSGDFDYDGKADVLWRHATNGELWIWLMDRTAIKQVTRVARVPTEYGVAGVGDFDLDGKADILWRHATNGETWLWLMDGTASKSQSFLGWADPSYHVAGVADVSGNGMADIVWHHPATGQVWLWKMNGAAITSRFLVGTMFDPAYEIVAFGDYNGDRPVDILWRHPVTGTLWMWLMGGSGLLSEIVKVGQVEDVGYHVVTPR